MNLNPIQFWKANRETCRLLRLKLAFVKTCPFDQLIASVAKSARHQVFFNKLLMVFCVITGVVFVAVNFIHPIKTMSNLSLLISFSSIGFTFFNTTRSLKVTNQYLQSLIDLIYPKAWKDWEQKEEAKMEKAHLKSSIPLSISTSKKTHRL